MPYNQHATSRTLREALFISFPGQFVRASRRNTVDHDQGNILYARRVHDQSKCLLLRLEEKELELDIITSEREVITEEMTDARPSMAKLAVHLQKLVHIASMNNPPPSNASKAHQHSLVKMRSRSEQCASTSTPNSSSAYPRSKTVLVSSNQPWLCYFSIFQSSPSSSGPPLRRTYLQLGFTD